MRLFNLMLLAVAVTLTVSPAFAQPSDRDLREYVRDAWDVASLTDETAREMFEVDYEGIPFRSWIGFFFAAPDVLDPLARQDYREAAEAAGEIAAERTFDYALTRAGLSGVSATAQLATLPIELGLRAFQRAVADRAFETQAALYFEARRHHSAEEIMRAEPGELLTGDRNPMTKDDQGWLYRRRAQHVPEMTPRELYTYAEAMWQAQQSRGAVARSEASVASDFRDALFTQVQPEDLLWRGTADLDGDGELDVVTISAVSPELMRESSDDDYDGCVSASTPDQRCRAVVSVGKETAEITVNWQRGGMWGAPLEVKSVDIDQSDGRQELIIEQAGREKEDPWREFVVVLYNGDRLTVQPLWHSSGYNTGALEVSDGQVTTHYDSCPTETWVSYRIEDDQLRLVEVDRREKRTSRICAACPTVYVQVDESEQRMGEVLRYLDTASKKGWQRLRLFALADDRLEVIIREEKEETTFLDAVQLEVDGRRYLPASCQHEASAAWCDADDDVHVMNTGDELRLTFELDEPINTSSIPRLIANGHYLPLQ